MLVHRVWAGVRPPSAPPARHTARAHSSLSLAIVGMFAGLASLTGCAFEVADDTSAEEERIGEHSSAIEGGYLDAADRAVVGLAILGSTGRLARTCSGVLVAPDVVLTAQHCIADSPDMIHCDSSAFGPEVEPVHVFATTSAEMWGGEATWTRAREVLTPPGGAAVCGRDMAMVVLSSPLPEDEATPLSPRIDHAPEEGEPYAAVGFGNTSGEGDDAGVRRRRDGLRVECVGYRCGTSEQVAGNEWRGDAGACNGDSGGPAIDEDGRVLGITSRGPSGCNDPIYGALTAHRQWIIEHASRAAETAGYQAPAWVTEGAADSDLLGPEELDERWASCSAASAGEHGRAGGGATGVIGGVGAFAALAMARSRRRRARDA